MKVFQFIRYIIVLMLIFAINANICNASNHTAITQFTNTYISTSPQILTFQCDPIGITWIGTSEGLYSYDGYRYTRQFEPHHFTNVRIHAICQFGNIMYLGTDIGLLTYNLRNGKYNIADNRMKVVRCLLADGTDIIAGTANGLFCYNTTNGESAKLGNIDKSIYSLIKYGDNILSGTISGLYKYNNGKTEEIVINKDKNLLVNSLLYDKGRNCLWIGTEGELYKMCGKGIERITYLSGNSIKSIAIDNNKNLFIGTDNGLYSIDGNGNTEIFRHSSSNPRSIANNIIWALYVDKYQNLWAGTDNGVSMTRGDSYYKYITTDEITGRDDGNCLQAILRDSKGTLWTGGSNGLIRYSSGIATWYNQSNSTHYLTHNRVRRIYEDMNGDIWIATDHGINHLNNETGQFDNYILYDKTGKYSTTWAYDILCDKDNWLWVASYMGGIFIINKHKLLNSNGKCVADHHIDDSNNRLPDIHVGQLAIDSQGYIWAMMYDNGVAIINPKDMKTITVKGTKDTQCMTADKNGNIWVALASKVLRFKAGGNKQNEYPINNTDGMEAVRCICTVGKDAWVFIGNHCRIITPSNKWHDIIIPQLNPISSFYCKENDYVYIGGNDGILKLEANTGTKCNPKHNLYLSELLINGKPHLGDKEQRAIYSKHITIKHDENNITFELTDLPYDNMPSHRYAYRLEGSNERWKQIGGNEMRLTYNGLPYGNYRLIIKTIDTNGNPASEIYSMNITILPPWYLSVWAKIAYTILIICLLLWTMNFYIVRRNLKLEQKEKENIIQQSKSRAKFYTNISDRLLCQLRQMIPAIQKLMATTDNNTQKELSTLKRSTDNINMLVHQDLSIDGMSHNVSKAKNEIDIIEFSSLWAEHSEDMKISTTLSPVSLMLNIDVVKLDFVYASIIEYIYNKVKHPVDIEIAVEQIEANHTVQIKIGSEKLYIAEPDRHFIFQRYYRPTDMYAEIIEMQPLYIANDYVEECDGQISVEVRKNSGMNITIELPYLSANAKDSENAQNIMKDSDEKLLGEVTRTIEAHLADSDFNVSSLQEELGIGGKLLSRKLKNMTAKTPVEYIRHIRLQKAAYMLREGKFTVSEVMYMVGFNKPGYFSKCFHDAFGLTPSEYIKKQR